MVRIQYVAWLVLPAFFGLALATPPPAACAENAPADDGLSALAAMSLEDLTDVDISSVSKRVEKRSDAAAAIHVITQEDIRRSTAVSLPDLLRMAPGIHVASLDANKRSISARGFSGRYANSLLILVDGRSIYTPLFSGTEWEIADMMLEDIDRIEIIRGPGGALWGANAVNGVINIVTKSAADTQGGLLSLGSGTEFPGFGGLRYGGGAGEHGAYRLHLRYLQRDESLVSGGSRAADDARNVRGGARWDWDWGDTQFTLLADLYGGDIGQLYEAGSGLLLPGQQRHHDAYFSGGDVLGRWTRTFGDGGELRIQGYYDRSEANRLDLDEERNTADMEVQYRMAARGRHEFMFGAGFRYYDVKVDGNTNTSLTSPSHGNPLFSAFVQDRIALLEEELVLTLGTKLEHNDFTGVEIQPSARLAWTPNEKHTLWAAVSRAVRTPSLIEEAGRVKLASFPGVAVALFGDDSFDAEQLLAFEAGYRVALSEALEVDLALFYNRYDGLRSLELDTPFFEAPFQLAVPFRTRNNLDGKTYGLELGLDWMPATWWRMRLNYSLLEMDLDLKPDSIDIVSGGFQESSPEQQGYLSSHFDLGRNVALDLALRYTDRLAALGIDDYLTADARVAWRSSDDFEVAVVAHDLLAPEHDEYDSRFTSTVASRVQRGVYGKITWRF